MKKAETKFTEGNLIWVFKNKNGKIIFLEKGNQKGGFEHILKHKKEFLDKGIKEDEISDFIMKVLKEGKIIGYQGKKILDLYIK
ncbi:hypothetical protein RCZ16_11980 [Capnocytophaga catalasegens]|uniref:Uncharacterized protein n=2 Tax=Capnocytophaga catalasegens TaxID=1004260 RepID=A0ABQ4VQ32_9FLAO|nr:hypothetical protein RCZ16_11980 [Capnocytophaga catalasegens]